LEAIIGPEEISQGIRTEEVIFREEKSQTSQTKKRTGIHMA